MKLFEKDGSYISVLPGSVTLYGDIGTQVFKMNLVYPLEVVPSLPSVRAMATLHTIWEVDKAKTFKNLNDNFSREVAFFIYKHIADCDCSYQKMVSKIFSKVNAEIENDPREEYGLALSPISAWLVPVANGAYEEFVRTCKMFHDFLEHLTHEAWEKSQWN